MADLNELYEKTLTLLVQISESFKEKEIKKKVSKTIFGQPQVREEKKTRNEFDMEFE